MWLLAALGCAWPALEVLNVARNKLKTLLPVASAAQLQVLKADGNELADASDVPLALWLRLKVLSLSHNALREVPSGIGQLSHLEALDVTHNNLRQLPAELGALREKTLKTLQLIDGNDLDDKNRLAKIMSKGKKPIKDLLDFVRSKDPAPAPKGKGGKAAPGGPSAGKKDVWEDAAGRKGGAGGKMKMSKRQAELYRKTLGARKEKDKAGCVSEEQDDEDKDDDDDEEEAASSSNEGTSDSDVSSSSSSSSSATEAMASAKNRRKAPKPGSKAAQAAEASARAGTRSTTTSSAAAARAHTHATSSSSDSSSKSDSDREGGSEVPSETESESSVSGTSGDRDTSGGGGGRAGARNKQGGGGGEKKGRGYKAWVPGEEKLEIPTDAFTGVAFKSEAELMVERGEANDLDHARKLIRNAKGLGGFVEGQGGGKGKGKGGKGGAGRGADGCGHKNAGGGLWAGEEVETLYVPEGGVGRLIGKGGATIKSIQVSGPCTPNIKPQTPVPTG